MQVVKRGDRTVKMDHVELDMSEVKAKRDKRPTTMAASEAMAPMQICHA